MLRQLRVSLLLLCLVFLALASARPVLVKAQTDVTSVSIIGAVNALRASLNLPAYQVDPYLMAYAQQHAEYQAKINSLTHTHSDGSKPSQTGVLEDIAYSSIGSLDVETLLSKMWSDTTHSKTIIGYHTGTIGVGVAANTDNVYVSLDVRPNAAPAVTVTPTNPSTEAAPSVAPTGIVQKTALALSTAAPDANGALVHVVTEGQTLWSIAVTYGVTINDLRSLNDLPAGFTNIIPGQKLIVRLAPTATATLPATDTATPEPPTNTPLPPTPSFTPTQTETLVPIPATAEPPATFPMMPLLAAALFILGGGGLFFASMRLRSAS